MKTPSWFRGGSTIGITAITSAHADPVRSNAIAYPSISALPIGVIGVVYLAAYLLLDWVSFIEPYAHFGITPWNPGTGLSFVLVLLFGRRMIPFLFVAPLLSDLIQIQPPLPLVIVFLSSVLIGIGYSAALIFLSRPGLRFDPKLPSMRDLMLLTLVAAISACTSSSRGRDRARSAGSADTHRRIVAPSLRQ